MARAAEDLLGDVSDSSRSDDDEIGIFLIGDLEEDVHRRPVMHQPPGRYASIGERGAPGVLERLDDRLAVRRCGQRLAFPEPVKETQRVDGDELSLERPCELDSPHERSTRALGAIESCHDSSNCHLVVIQVPRVGTA